MRRGPQSAHPELGGLQLHAAQSQRRLERPRCSGQERRRGHEHRRGRPWNRQHRRVRRDARGARRGPRRAEVTRQAVAPLDACCACGRGGARGTAVAPAQRRVGERSCRARPAQVGRDVQARHPSRAGAVERALGVHTPHSPARRRQRGALVHVHAVAVLELVALPAGGRVSDGEAGRHCAERRRVDARVGVWRRVGKGVGIVADAAERHLGRAPVLVPPGPVLPGALGSGGRLIRDHVDERGERHGFARRLRELLPPARGRMACLAVR
mmetsp:Transcript_25928/g.97682  ORF Transcript_25928/g.97682 Transcript_25928/m.97682 type:complete len:269 (+) Transcript_25928:3525-4331(+)